MQRNIVIRPVQMSDATGIQSIYNYYVNNTVFTFDYETPPLEKFENLIQRLTSPHTFLVAEIEQEVVGYAYTQPFQKERAAYRFACEISLYTKKEIEAKGLGQALLNALFKEAQKNKLVTAIANITAKNSKSIAFFERNGFTKIGHFPNAGYKFGKWHDTIWMHRYLNQPM